MKPNDEKVNDANTGSVFFESKDKPFFIFIKNIFVKIGEGRKKHDKKP